MKSNKARGLFWAAVLWTCRASGEPIAECQVITASGEYQLSADVSAPQAEICFSIRASNVVLDGMGHTITVSDAAAVEVAHYADLPPTNVTVRNLSSNGGVRVYGDGVSQVTFERLTVDGIYNGAGDGVTIQDNIVGTWGIVSGNNDNDDWFGYRPRILRNEIHGGSTDVKILLEVIGGALHPCPRLDAVVEDNVVVNTRDDPPPEATASVRVRCATHTRFRRNRIVSLGTTIGLYLRDESDDGIYEDNVFVSNTEETIRIASGNEDKTLPARNLFRGNVFRSEAGAATYLQGIGADNRFEHNCFWSQATGLLNMSAGNAFDHNSFYVAGADEAVITLTYRDDVSDSWTNNVLSYEGSDVYRFDGFAFHRYAGDYNLFHNRAGAVAFGAFGATLADWQAQSAAAGFASDVSSSEANPSFADAAAGDLCLQPGSPGIGAAADGSTLGATTCRCVAPSDLDVGGAGGQSGLGGTGGTPVAGDGPSDEGGCGCGLVRSHTPHSTTAGIAGWLALVAVSGRRWHRRRLFPWGA